VIKIKKLIFLTTKVIFSIIATLVLILFIYTAFFYKSNQIAQDLFININQEETIDEQEREEERKAEELELQKKINEQNLEKAKALQPIKTIIKDGLYVTVGNKAITKSDIVNEIKTLLILNNKKFTEDIRMELRQMAIRSLIKRNIKKIEIEKNSFLKFNENDLRNELERVSKNMGVDLKTLKEIFKSNNLDISLLEDQLSTDLLWNSLIFAIYKNRISIDIEEIEEQLKLIEKVKKINEYLISEIVIDTVEKDKVNATIKNLKDKILIEGFDNVAKNLSISDSASKNGDLGWINENSITDEFRKIIINTTVGDISDPVLSPNGILIFKVRNKKTIEKNIDMELVKEQLVNAEKTKILKMHSLSHYNNAKGSISISFFQ